MFTPPAGDAAPPKMLPLVDAAEADAAGAAAAHSERVSRSRVAFVVKPESEHRAENGDRT